MTPKVNGQTLKMKLDIGSAVSTQPVQKYEEMFPNIPLVTTDAILKTYSGEKIALEGKLHVRVEYNNQVKDLTLYVAKTRGPALFRRDWLHQIQLDWKLIFAIAKEMPTQDIERKLDELRDKYGEVFQDNIGTQLNSR